MGPQIESDRRKVRIDFEAGRATSRSASGLFSFLCNAICCLCIAFAPNSLGNVLACDGPGRSNVLCFAGSCFAGLTGPFFRLPLRRVVVQINPYESVQTQGGDGIQRRGGSLVVKIFVVISFLICTLLVFLAGWAWRQYWTYQRVPQNVGSFPYRAFAYDATQWAVVGCLAVLAFWSVYWCIRWGRTRAAKG